MEQKVGFLTKVLPVGAAGAHPTTDLVPLLLGPSTGAEFNTVSVDLAPVACLNLSDLLFEFDSSFVNPEAIVILTELAPLRLGHANARGDLPRLAVFGHADPVGKDEYNKQLSGRRARAIYGLLIHDARIWEQLIDQPVGGDNWHSASAVSKMRSVVGPAAPSARRALIQSYMQLLCPVPLAPTDFIAMGTDPDLRGDVQGCGEFNPLRILSASENKQLPVDDRDALNKVNRRVVVYLFRPGLKVNAKLWPCPSATEPTAGCRARFFANGDQRRAEGPERREHVPPKDRKDKLDQRKDDTFACRFYARMANLSPCERILKVYMIRLFDRTATPLPGAPWELFDGVSTRIGLSDPETAFITVHDLRVPNRCTLKWSRPVLQEAASTPSPNGDFEFEMDVFVDLPESVDDESTMARLHNLGYTAGASPEDDIRSFQEDYATRFADLPLEPTGQLDSNTRAVAERVHTACDPVLKNTDRPG